MSKTQGNPKTPVKSEENDQELKPRADHPNERLQDVLQGRFPEGLSPFQSPKEENPDDSKDRAPGKRGKKRVPVNRQLPKSKEK